MSFLHHSLVVLRLITSIHPEGAVQRANNANAAHLKKGNRCVIIVVNVENANSHAKLKAELQLWHEGVKKMCLLCVCGERFEGGSRRRGLHADYSVAAYADSNLCVYVTM